MADLKMRFQSIVRCRTNYWRDLDYDIIFTGRSMLWPFA